MNEFIVKVNANSQKISTLYYVNSYKNIACNQNGALLKVKNKKK